MKFVNPYNFIPLTKEKTKYEKNETKTEELLTGKITVEIVTKSPLFIPDSSNENAFAVESADNEHKSYDFFKYGGEPVLPGSEIRGMLRNVYETLTGSCLSGMDDDQELVKRTNDIYQPGMIKKINGKYILVEAERSKCRDKNQMLIGQKTDQGYFLKGEIGIKKNAITYSYFNPVTPERKVCDIEEKQFQMIDIVLKSYQNPKTNKKAGHNGYKEYEKEFLAFRESTEDGYFPIYYSKVTGNLIYLSPACITKEAYMTKVSDILAKHGNFGPCKGEERCPACALFGIVNEKTAAASRLRFGDAKLVHEKNNMDELFWDNPVTLEELAQPKISAAEFYLKQPKKDAVFWTYDYYVDAKGNIHEEVPEIAGRKFYWHNTAMEFKTFQKEDRNKRNKTILPLKRKVVFQEEIFFERITNEQLQQLLAICNISNEYLDAKGEAVAGYKLGTARPLGLGSITMRVTNCVIRSLRCDENGISYQEEAVTEYAKIRDGKAIGFCPETIPPFVKMMHFDGAGNLPICYPVTDEQLAKINNNELHTEGFKWFQDNHGGLKNREKKPQYKESLPVVKG